MQDIWEGPPTHWIKLNVDAAWDKREACLARNSSGTGLKAWTKNLSIPSVIVAEMLVVRWGYGDSFGGEFLSGYNRRRCKGCL